MKGLLIMLLLLIVYLLTGCSSLPTRQQTMACAYDSIRLTLGDGQALNEFCEVTKLKEDL